MLGQWLMPTQPWVNQRPVLHRTATELHDGFAMR